MKYTTPEMEIVRFEAMEVMAASTGGCVQEIPYCDLDGQTGGEGAD